MRRLSLVISLITTFFSCLAQLPPSHLYDNLGIYQSVAVYEDGEQIDFSGVDYFYLDYENNGDVSVLFFTTDYGWLTTSAEYIEETSEYVKYSTTNPNGDELLFIISLDQEDIIVAKENSDISVAYALLHGNGQQHPLPDGYNNNYSNTYNGNSGSSSSGRICSSCSGSGKCKTCDGKGYYYHETGYYTGKSNQTRTTCPVCRGTGHCGTCHGQGSIR